MSKIITIFGSADLIQDSPEYSLAEDFGILLGKHGFDIATGGYGGIMEAVCKGASAFNVRRIGVLTDDLSHRTPNQYNSETIKTKDYFERLKKLVDLGSDYIAFNGSWGTMLEICTVISLIKRKLIRGKLICIGDRWEEIIRLINRGEAQSAEEILFTNDFHEIIRILKN